MNPDLERLQDLLADRAVFGLTDAEAAELKALLVLHPDFDSEAMDRLAANLVVSTLPEHLEPLPATLQARILDASVVSPRASAAPLRWLPWAALAASVMIAFGAWWFTRPPAVRGPGQLREELLAQASRTGSDLIRIDWTATKDPAAQGASGDVVWSSETQTGFLRFSGLAPNSPEREQYQLWIFDAARDERYPVDGGVFDMPAGEREVIVPIRPKLGVSKPVLFAITVEPPGGVVVSSRARLPLLAKVPERKAD